MRQGRAQDSCSPSEERKILGDASDRGLLVYCDRIFPVAVARAAFRPVLEVPFNSVSKFAVTVAADPGNPRRHVVFMKVRTRPGITPLGKAPPLSLFVARFLSSFSTVLWCVVAGACCVTEDWHCWS